MSQRNPFAALQTEEDEDAPQITAAAPAPAAASKSAKPAAPAQQKQQPAAKAAPREGGKSAGSKDSRPPRQGGEKKPFQVQQQDGVVVGVDHHGEKPSREHHTHRHVAGGSKRGGHESASAFRNERHSHHKQQHVTGKSTDRSWGNVKDGLEQEAAVVDAPEVAAPVDAGAPVEEAPAEEGVKQLSLDEYRRQQKERKAQTAALPAARQAGEGEDAKKWGNGQELVKEDASEETAAAAERKTQRSSKKQTIDINVKFSAEETSRSSDDGGFRGRGRGRGGPRGGSARGGRGGRAGPAQGGKSSAAGFNAADSDFPSL